MIICTKYQVGNLWIIWVNTHNNDIRPEFQKFLQEYKYYLYHIERNMDWNEEFLKSNLADKFIGQKVYFYPEIDSTNDEER